MARKPKEQPIKSDEELEREAIQADQPAEERVAIETVEVTKPIRHVAPPRLGFGPPPGRTVVYIGGEDDVDQPYCWYTLTGERDSFKRQPILDNCLIGYLHDVRVMPKIYQGKWGYKVYVSIMADKEYALRSGVDSVFTNRVVNSLATIEDLTQPICITVSKGSENKKVVFGNVSHGITGEGIYLKNEDLAEKISPVIFELQRRLGVEIQSGESIKQWIADQDEKRRS